MFNLSFIIIKHLYLVGGILSLLTGMSFLSLFEILFWLLRLPPKKEKQDVLPTTVKTNIPMSNLKGYDGSATNDKKNLHAPPSFEYNLPIKEMYHY